MITYAGNKIVQFLYNILLQQVLFNRKSCVFVSAYNRVSEILPNYLSCYTPIIKILFRCNFTVLVHTLRFKELISFKHIAIYKVRISLFISAELLYQSKQTKLVVET